MKSYTFYLYDREHAAPGFTFVPCDDAASASRHAELLLAHCKEYEEIEVFDGGDWRVRVTRDDHDEQGAAA